AAGRSRLDWTMSRAPSHRESCCNWPWPPAISAPFNISWPAGSARKRRARWGSAHIECVVRTATARWMSRFLLTSPRCPKNDGRRSLSVSAARPIASALSGEPWLLGRAMTCASSTRPWSDQGALRAELPSLHGGAYDAGMSQQPINTSYEDLLGHVLEHGERKADRTGTGTRSVFGHQMRYDLAAGFPLITTKRVHLKAIVHELLWFLGGETNIAYLRS